MELSAGEKVLRNVIELMKEKLAAGVAVENMVVRIDRESEAALYTLTRPERGEIVHKIVTEGVRAAFPKMFGLRIEWGASKLEVAPGQPAR